MKAHVALPHLPMKEGRSQILQLGQNQCLVRWYRAVDFVQRDLSLIAEPRRSSTCTGRANDPVGMLGILYISPYSKNELYCSSVKHNITQVGSAHRLTLSDELPYILSLILEAKRMQAK